MLHLYLLAKSLLLLKIYKLAMPAHLSSHSALVVMQSAFLLNVDVTIAFSISEYLLLVALLPRVD